MHGFPLAYLRRQFESEWRIDAGVFDTLGTRFIRYVRETQQGKSDMGDKEDGGGEGGAEESEEEGEKELEGGAEKGS